MFVLSIFLYAFAHAEELGQRTGKVIAIDLGTTSSRVSVSRNGKIEVIPNEFGSRITPSVLSFDSTERLIGDAATRRLTINPRETIGSSKRLMGLRFSDPALQSELKRLPYKVVNQDNRPFVEVSFNGEATQFSPEEITAMILAKMKSAAEDWMGIPVSSAVVTVPSCFTDAQRKATIDAGAIAGINILRILNDATAGALAYGFGKTDTKKVLVFDLGGGTLSVSVVHVEDGVFEVLATSGHNHLGGEDFTERIVAYMKALYRKKAGKDPSRNVRAIARLRLEAEKAKCELSSRHQVTIEIENFTNGEDFVETLTRAKFEELNEHLFRKAMKRVRNVIRDSGLSTYDINDIFLVGGSTRIPMIQKLVRDSFRGKEPVKWIDPHEAVARGAAIQAAVLSDEKDNHPGTVIILEANSFTLGIDTINGEMKALIRRNARLPAVKSTSLTTYKDKQEQIKIQMFQGEKKFATANHWLGSFDLLGIRAAPSGVPRINVTFVIDTNGAVSVSAVDQSTKANEEVPIAAHRPRLSEDQLGKAIARARAMKKDDEKSS